MKMILYGLMNTSTLTAEKISSVVFEIWPGKVKSWGGRVYSSRRVYSAKYGIWATRLNDLNEAGQNIMWQKKCWPQLILHLCSDFLEIKRECKGYVVSLNSTHFITDWSEYGSATFTDKIVVTFSSKVIPGKFPIELIVPAYWYDLCNLYQIES